MRKARARSTTCTSAATTALCGTSLAAALAMTAGAAGAACFLRDYDAAHLARNPAQGVAGLRLWLGEATAQGWPARLEVRMAGQGQGRRDRVAGRVLGQELWCTDGGAEAVCRPRCREDGDLDLSYDGQGRLRLGSAGLRLADRPGRCGGVSDLAEGGRTVYLLAPVPDGACRAMAER